MILQRLLCIVFVHDQFRFSKGLCASVTDDAYRRLQKQTHADIPLTFKFRARNGEHFHEHLITQELFNIILLLVVYETRRSTVIPPNHQFQNESNRQVFFKKKRMATAVIWDAREILLFELLSKDDKQ